MDLLPSADETEIVTSVAEVLREQAPMDIVREYAAPGDLSSTWAPLADLGLFGLGIESDLGGVGFGLAEEILTFRELGRALTPGPLLGTVLAAHLSAGADNADLTERIASGTVKVALAEPLADSTATATNAVSGRFRFLDPSGADLVLVVTPSGAALVEAASIIAEPVVSADPTVEIGVATLDSMTTIVWDNTDRTWWRGCALTAAISTGIAEATRDQSAAYAKVREQFSRPIGAFQAVKHRCADMAVRAESAYFQTVFAALSWSADDPNSTQLLASARVVASAAARSNGADNIQNHGAMGFSEEVDAHLFVRRSLVLETTLGTERWHLEHIGTRERIDW